MNFLQLKDKNIIIFGVANKRSIALAISKVLTAQGANIIHVVRDEKTKQATQKLLKDHPVITCDVEDDEQIAQLPKKISQHATTLHGMMHSIAFANFSNGIQEFYNTNKQDFLQAVNISCFSLVQLTRTLKPLFAPDASIVTMSISTTRMASESYGYMGPIKAALDSSVVFLAKSLSNSSKIRVNAVGASLLKTSASAGIPGYIDAYLFAEKAIPRKEALKTSEAANTAAFLLSPASSGINAQTIVVDAGMSINYFDKEIIRSVSKPNQ